MEEEWDGGPGNYEIVEEAEGMKLLPSSTNITGYQGVKQHSKKYHAQHGKRFLGSYKTALKAAVAYARYLKEKRGGDGNEEVEDEEAATEEARAAAKADAKRLREEARRSEAESKAAEEALRPLMVEDSPVEVGMAVDVKQWERVLSEAGFVRRCLICASLCEDLREVRGVSYRHRRL